MLLIALGINHETAPVSVREQLAIPSEQIPHALQDLKQTTGVHSGVILSTCNRTELYCGINPDAVQKLTEWMQRYSSLDTQTLKECIYQYQDNDAIRHLLRVASGLNSMVLGEPEILGQIKDAYQIAQSQGMLEATLDRLFQHSFSVAKKVRHDTEIGRHPVSVAFSAVTLAKRVFGQLDQSTVLLVGAGETIELVAKHLLAQQVKHLIVANRTLERAQNLANQFYASAIPLSSLNEHLAKADLIISSTGAKQSIITGPMMIRAIHARKRKPVFAVDLAVPRDFEAIIGEMDDVYLYTIDDMREVAQAGMDSRRQAAQQAEQIIQLQIDKFNQWQQSRLAADLIKRYRQSAEDIRQQLLENALSQLDSGKPASEVLEKLSNTLTNRILHAPSKSLRTAAENGRSDLLQTAETLFGLEK